MPHLILSPIVSSCRYENDMLIQQMNSPTLLLSHRQCDTFVIRYDLTLSIAACPINFSYIQPIVALLELPVQKFSFYHPKHDNYIDLKTNIDCPVSDMRKVVSTASFADSSLIIDITTLFQYWNPNMNPVCDIHIRIEEPGLLVCIKKSPKEYPQIHMEYKTIPYNRFPLSVLKEPVYMELSRVAIEDCFVGIDQNIKLHIIESKSKSGIDYSKDSGEFSFSITGSYYMHWALYIHGAGDLDRLDIGLKNLSTKELFQLDCPCVIPGQIYGQHILHVTDTSFRYVFTNCSKATIQLCQTVSNASIIIIKL